MATPAFDKGVIARVPCSTHAPTTEPTEPTKPPSMLASGGEHAEGDGVASLGATAIAALSPLVHTIASLADKITVRTTIGTGSDGVPSHAKNATLSAAKEEPPTTSSRELGVTNPLSTRARDVSINPTTDPPPRAISPGHTPEATPPRA